VKTIGVIGGISPQATMDFEQRVHAIAQQLIPQRANSGYPPMVVYYHRRAPMITDDDNRPILPMRPDPQLAEAARKLGEWADFLVITANGPHLMCEPIEDASGLEIVSMIDVTLDEVQRRGLNKVGVLAFTSPMVYKIPLDNLGIANESIGEELQARLDRAVLSIMEGNTGPEHTAAAREAVQMLRAKGADGIIMGCTEIPLLLEKEAEAPDLINPAHLLAEAAVRYAMS
jgi:aspartate racemase